MPPGDADPYAPLALLEAALHHLPDACLIIDDSDRILSANDAARELIKPRGRLTGRRLETILADRRVSLMAADTIAHCRGQAVSVTLRLPGEGWRDDRFFMARTACIALAPDTRVARLTLTEDAEAGRTSREAVPAPSRDILLQLRSPLSVVQGYLENLLDGMITDPVAMRKSLLTIRKSTVQIERVLESLKQ